ncbi:WD repeat-containing protein 53 [Hypomesus transpacificus]|uniref:WD repeat-containing protein 53 n=1 Tax=Hypomesus transpacificus TaxID=137520 RepID=UPI001F083AE7|nr:WD repeat-containing protein 53 [Hypomesus transpacificus]
MSRRWSGGPPGPVLCVGAAVGPHGLLASGSEGGAVRVWSQEGSVVGSLSLPREEDVTSAVFSPTGLLYVAHGETVSVLDPRSLKGAVQELREAGEEEINALALDESGSLLALADDTGAVRVLELPGGRLNRTLRRHTNICSSIAFRPHRPNNLVSAGLDMQVMLWSLQKTRPLWTVSLQEEDEHQQRAGELLNPPLAHCVSVATCGNVLACAAEDGRVHLLRVGAGSKLEQQGALRAHSQGASQAHFLHCLPHPYWLVTGGNDGLVALWDLSQHPVVAPQGNAHTRLQGAPRRKAKGRGKVRLQASAKALVKAQQGRKEKTERLWDKGQRVGEEGERGGEEGDPGSSIEPSPGQEEEQKAGPKVSFHHGDKVNWICPALLKGEPSLVVADQSPSLTVYSLAGL